MSSLHRSLVTANDAAPTRWLLALHGILGSGQNLRSLGRRLVDAAPTWGVVLVDLRMHGLSQGFAPPHTVAAAAEDLRALEAELPGPIGGVLGHSFGGKVALVYAGLRETPLERLVLLDPPIGANPTRRGTSDGILRLLEGLPRSFTSRDAFVTAVRSTGHSAAIAEWLAMNVRRSDDGFRLRLDLEAIRALLDDTFAVDGFPVLEGGRAAERVDVIVGGKSETLDAQDRARLGSLAERGLLRLHVLPDAGHLVHVDDPDGVFALVRDALLGQVGAA